MSTVTSTRFLITGGAGFIGSHLADRLLRDGATVIAFDNLSTGRADNLRHLLDHPRFEFVRGSAEDPLTVDALVARCDAVFHLAAALGVKLVVEQPVRAMRTTIHSTEIVLEAADRWRRPVLLTSSSEVYGKSAAVPFREDDDVVMGATRYNRWSYAYAKGVCEFLALAYHRDRGLPATVVRLFNTVGPRQLGQYGMVLPRFAAAAVNNEPVQVYGEGAQTRCFCHVHDVVDALARLIDAPSAAGEVFNVGSDDEISITELARRVIRLSGSTSRIEHLPYEAAYGRQFDDLPRRVPSITKLRAAIGFTPTFTTDQIIESVIAHARETQSGSSAAEPDAPRGPRLVRAG